MPKFFYSLAFHSLMPSFYYSYDLFPNNETLLRYQRVHSLGEKVLIWMCNINIDHCCCCCSVTKSCLTLQPRGLQHSRLTCPPLSPRVCSSSCLLSWWCYLSISSSATLFSFCLQSFPASGSESFLKSRVFASSGQSIGASASVLSMNIQVDFL